jgi:hypothetical protein
MTYSNTIPADVIPYLREGARVEGDDALRELGIRKARALNERDLEQLEPLRERCSRHAALLDLIGWREEDNSEAVEMATDDHRLAALEAGERYQRDYQDDLRARADIAAFFVAVGLKHPRRRPAD